MSNTERDLARQRSDLERSAQQKTARDRRAMVQRIKDIVWSAVIASVLTIMVVTALGWLTTQAVVEKARQEGGKELVALRASICLVRFEQRPDAKAKLAEFKALSYNEQDTAIKGFITKEGLATMLGEDAPAPGSIDKCTDAIRRSSYSS